jgi:NitT/TauT family transport system permease protein
MAGSLLTDNGRRRRILAESTAIALPLPKRMLQGVRDTIAMLFAPNGGLSKKAFVWLALGQLAAVVIYWCTVKIDFVPFPWEVYAALKKLWMEEGLLRHLWVSLKLNLMALGISTFLSLLLAYSTRIPFFRPIVGFLTKLRYLGYTGLVFLFMVTVGTGYSLKLSLLVFGITTFFLTNMCAVVNNITKEWYTYGRSIRLSEWKIIWHVVIRQQMPLVIDTLRQNAAMGWMLLTMVEYFSRSAGGIGVLLLNEDRHLNMAAMFANQGVVLALGLGFDAFYGRIKAWTCKWAMLAVGQEGK